jgi:hypothetical protein
MMPFNRLQTELLDRARQARRNCARLRHALAIGQRAMDDVTDARSAASALIMESRALRHRTAELAQERGALLRALAERSPELLPERLWSSAMRRRQDNGRRPSGRDRNVIISHVP